MFVPDHVPFNQQEVAFGDPIAAAEYDKQIFDAWVSQLASWAGSSAGLDILEIGPGHTLGTQILLAEKGNKVTVADPYPPRWHSAFHPAAYLHLAGLIGGSPKLEAAAKASSLDDIGIRRVSDSAEKLSSLRDREFDVVLSNAVLEHVQDIDRVCAELARVTKLGGTHIHQIDVGYHNNRERPLDHLLMTDQEFFAEANAAHFEYGNRWRASEFIARFEKVGLVVKYMYVTHRADDEYFLQAVRQIRNSRRTYSYWPAEDLRILSFMIVASRVTAKLRLVSLIKGCAAIAVQKLRKWRRLSTTRAPRELRQPSM